jgi:hypothetical protein
MKNAKRQARTRTTIQPQSEEEQETFISYV